ncbi:MAG: aspartate-semialdehyde dehydrogenase [Clostridia bacterium]|nr:aspartate-semialdehyde dehydrogenase [Clostridia bacterium]
MENKLRVGVIGATGMVGQRFLTLLDNHPYFNVVALAASARSAGQRYEDALAGRWKLTTPMPEWSKDMVIYDAARVEEFSALCDFVFCAVNMPKDQIKELEYAYAKAETPVVSNNSAHRWTPDVPMIIPEINPDHAEVINAQRARLGTKRGFIAVKPNCSIQSYVPLITPLMKEFEPTEIAVTTYQAISGAGKTFNEFPEILDNIIPYIGGEEEKSEQEPLKVWGKNENGEIVKADSPLISAQCLRVPVSDGHTAAVFVNFKNKPTKEQILECWRNFSGKPQELELPSAPKQFITYFEENDYPQSKLHRDVERGMGITVGRLREDALFQWKFVGLSHNTLRGAAGGAVLTAELLTKLGYITAK